MAVLSNAVVSISRKCLVIEQFLKSLQSALFSQNSDLIPQKLDGHSLKIASPFRLIDGSLWTELYRNP